MSNTKIFHELSGSCLRAVAAISLLLGLVLASPAHAQVTVTPIVGAPWITLVGNDDSFQVVDSATGFDPQYYPNKNASYPENPLTSDLGWVVGFNGAAYGPDFTAHGAGTAAFGLTKSGVYVPSYGSLTGPVSGSGSATDPYAITTQFTLLGGQVTKESRVRYSDGQGYVIYELVLTNLQSGSATFNVFFGGNSPFGFETFHDPANGSVGATACTSAALVGPGGIALAPLTPADAFTVDQDGGLTYWEQVADGGLDDQVDPGTCDGLVTFGLQWTRTLDPGEATVIQVASLQGVEPPAPFDIDGVMPASGQVGTSVAVTINGQAFLDSTTFDFGGGITVQDLAIVDSSTATATLVIASDATTGPHDVIARQGPAGAVATATGAFLVQPAPPPLELTSVTPGNGEAGAASLSVTISGSGFQPDVSFDFGPDITVGAIVIQDSTTATANLAIDAGAATGPRDVTATQNAGSESVTLTDGFTVDPPFVPLALTGVAPPNGAAGTTNLSVTVSGEGFNSGLSLDFGPGIVVQNFFVQDANTVLATLDIDGSATPGPRDVSATQADVTVTLTDGFTVDPAFVPLALTAVAPDNGDPGAGYDSPELGVTITGSGFDSSLSLDFGPGITLSGVLVKDSGTALSYLLIDPSAKPGPRNVIATQGAQTYTLTGGFTVNPLVAPPPLTVLGVDPAHAMAGTSLAVTIDASGLVPPDSGRGTTVAVDFGPGIAVSGISADYDSTPQHVFATLDIDADAMPGPRTVTVGNGGTVAELIDGFVVDSTDPADFTLVDVSPASGAQGTLVYVVLGGSGFQTDTTFAFGADTLVRDLRILGPDRASLRLDISADATLGPRTVSAVQTLGGPEASLPGAFTVVAPPPVDGGEAGTLVFALTASTPGPLRVGDAFSYTLSLRNFSGAPVGQILVEDALPANLTVTGLDCAGGVIEEGVLTWSLAGLDDQEGASCDVAVTLDAIAGDGSVVNEASVRYTNGSGQIIRYSTVAAVGTVAPPRLESVTVSGAPTTEDSIEPALSADGSILVFSSLQKDLVEGNPNSSGGADVYLRDRRTGEMRVINRDRNGNPLLGESRSPDVSLNGQAIAFVFQPAAEAQGMAKDGEAPSGQLCSSQPNALFQMECDTTGTNGEPLDGDVESPSLSADGKLLAFCSSASNWVADDTNGVKDVFLKDQVSGEVTRVSVAEDGSEADGASCDPMISANGKYVAFTTNAPSLGGTSGAKQIVRKDLASGELLLVTGDSGAPADADAGKPSISSDGSRIAFASRAGNLVPGVGGGVRNLYVFQAGEAGPRNLAKGGGSANSLFVMLGTGDELPDGDSSDPKIACSGNAVGFTSEAGNLVNGDTNAQNDYFVFGIESGEITRPGAEATGTEPNGGSDDAALDCEATTGAYDTTATDAGNPNPNADVMSQSDPLRGTSNAIVLDGSFSGNWYDPGQSGHGFLLEALPGGDFYVTWYTYFNGEPLFLQGRATPNGNELNVEMFDARSTGFPVGAGGATTRTWGTVLLSFGSSNDAMASWTPVIDGFMPGTMNLRRLTRAALVESNRDGVGDACYSGIWYDRSNSGYGFDIEFNDKNDGSRTVTAYWYTYQPDGEPLWLIGTGPADPDGANMDLYVFAGAGAQFPPAFAASSLSRTRWGQATLRFSPDQLRVDYAATLPGYGSGSLNLQRLTVLEDRECAE